MWMDLVYQLHPQEIRNLAKEKSVFLASGLKIWRIHFIECLENALNSTTA